MFLPVGGSFFHLAVCTCMLKTTFLAMVSHYSIDQTCKNKGRSEEQLADRQTASKLKKYTKILKLNRFTNAS